MLPFETRHFRTTVYVTNKLFKTHTEPKTSITSSDIRCVLCTTVYKKIHPKNTVSVFFGIIHLSRAIRAALY